MRERANGRPVGELGRQSGKMLFEGRQWQIGLNLPRISSQAFGFRSHVFSWLGPPHMKRGIHLLERFNPGREEGIVRLEPAVPEAGQATSLPGIRLPGPIAG